MVMPAQSQHSNMRVEFAVAAKINQFVGHLTNDWKVSDVYHAAITSQSPELIEKAVKEIRRFSTRAKAVRIANEFYEHLGKMKKYGLIPEGTSIEVAVIQYITI